MILIEVTHVHFVFLDIQMNLNCNMFDIYLELHVDNQSLTTDQNLIFDPKTCAGLSKRLQVLNTSGNRMIDLCPLHQLSSLTRYILVQSDHRKIIG